MKSRKTATRKAPARSAGRQQLRIIGGEWRGRRLTFAGVDGLRPTGDRVRETLFNWLMNDIVGARCLDLFSGSGALGLEALSRGAVATTLIERDAVAARQIAANLELLQADNAELVQTDALAWLGQRSPTPYDLVFVDPPFELELWPTSLDLLQHNGWLAPGARVYVEAPRHYNLQTPDNWQLLREKQAGDVNFCLFDTGDP